MTVIPLSNINSLKHLRLDNLQGRIIPLHPVHDGLRWHLWIIDGDRVRDFEPVDVCEAYYFGSKRVSNDDLCIQFLEFINQRALWPDVSSLSDAILSDILNIAASFEKLRILHSSRDDINCARMVLTEIEYLFVTGRSIFDLLQEIIRSLWRRSRMQGNRVKCADLPETYSKMISLTVEQLQNKYALPPRIAEAYIKTNEFFVWLRAFRDLIAHRGATTGIVFGTILGFCVDIQRSPFRDMRIWCRENTQPNNLGSLLSAISYIVYSILAALDRFTIALLENDEWPPQISPDYRLFVRGHHLQWIRDCQDRIVTRPWLE